MDDSVISENGWEWISSSSWYPTPMGITRMILAALMDHWIDLGNLEELCFWLVGQGHPFEKYEPVNWDDDYSQDSWENKIDGNQTTNQCFQCCLIQLEDVNN